MDIFEFMRKRNQYNVEMIRVTTSYVFFLRDSLKLIIGYTRIVSSIYGYIRIYAKTISIQRRDDTCTCIACFLA